MAVVTAHAPRSLFGVVLALVKFDETASVFVQLREPARHLVDVLLRYFLLRAFQSNVRFRRRSVVMAFVFESVRFRQRSVLTMLVNFSGVRF